MKNTRPQQYAAIFSTELGNIGLQFEADKLVKIDYLDKKRHKRPENKIAEMVQRKIENYLNAQPTAKKISVNVKLNVTPFQQKVLTELQKIPSGQTRTYGQIAKILNTSPRAVGNACRSNPLPIIIPCHRVVAAGGIGGYNGVTEGKMLDIKYMLLKLEGVI